ncbi:MAG: PD40 domain-containing protein, partial [Rhizobacter sp.]|nr:PD40 domain-containing protein [Bacteriovorax sp.]
MKFLMTMILLVLSSTVFADMVFMRESGNQKHIMHMNAQGAVDQITSGDLVHLYPDITPDGKNVVYVEGTISDDGSQDLYLVTKNLVTGTTEKWLSPELKGMILHPKFSKNAQFIFFSAPSPKNKIFYFEPSKFKNKSTKTGDVTTLSFKAEALDKNDEAYFPRPSSDGNMVVYQRNTNGVREVVLYNRLDDSKTVIDQGMSPSLSFDEQKIAYTSKKAGTWDIYEYDRQTQKVVRKTFDDSTDEMAPTYNPSNELIFASSKTGSFQLYKLNGSDWTRLTNIADTDDYAPQFSGETIFSQGTRTPFMAPMRSSFGTILHDGLLYMCGGHQGKEHTYPQESFTNNFNVYDRTTNIWKELAPRPIKAHGYTLAAKGNYIYAFGGFTFAEQYNPQWKSISTIDRYDIRTNTWTTIGALNSPRSSNVAVTVGDKVYLVGGWDSTPKHDNDLEGTFQSAIEVFDLNTETVSIAPYSMPNPLRRAFTGLEYKGKILLVGGLGVGSSHFELISKVTMLDPITGAITELPELPFGTFAPAAETIGNELFVFGGMFKTGDMNYEYVSHIYGYNFDNQTWRHTGRFLKESKGFAQVFKMDNRMIGILGGH